MTSYHITLAHRAMRGRPPKPTLTPEQESAASAFVDAAEAPDSGSGRATRGTTDLSPRLDKPGEAGVPTPVYPWEAPRVRADVTKGYALRLPEPLYLQLKWVADQTGRSMNTLCREAVEAEVVRHLGGAAATGLRNA